MTEQHKLSKEKIQLRKGSIIKLADGEYVLNEFVNSNEVILRRLDDNKIEVAHLSDVIANLSPTQVSTQIASDEMLTIPKKALKEAKKRLEAMKPLLELGSAATSRDIKIQAAKVGYHYTTLYRWLKQYNATQSLVSLVPQRRGWSKKKLRIDDEVNQIINHNIDTYYLTKARLTPRLVFSRIKDACEKAGLKPPSQSTVYRRIEMVPEERRLRARGHLELAQNRYAVRAGKFPGADTILSVIQIDHTPLDIIIVDDEHRESIKRVWLTMAIDVYSRMVVGFYLSLDAPSTTSVAMCLSHSIIPKQSWLKHLGIELDWMVWGIPKKVHVDNGPDFTSDTLRLGCMENNINLEFRPVAKPQYGGHIERLLGTFQNLLKDLDGKTFNSPKTRGNYDSEKNAIFDFESLERWLTNAIIRYHHTTHDSVGVPPATKWMMAVEGDLDEIPRGWPDLPSDPLSVELSFMPYTLRAVRSQGIVWDHIYYFSDGIRHLIGQLDEKTRKPKKHVVRRDPRNITRVWVYDEAFKVYHKVPFADPTMRFMSKWDLQDVKNHLKKRGHTKYNQDMVALAFQNMQQIEETAREKTKDARRKLQQQRQHRKAKTPADIYQSGLSKEAKTAPENESSKSASHESVEDDPIWNSDIEDFDIE